MVMPRIVVAAPASGQGKTTVSIGLMAALRQAGHKVAPFKVGPDYIDPGYHTLAAGRQSRNLDPHLCSEELIGPLFKHGFEKPEPADIAVIEGVMGLFDGKLGTVSSNGAYGSSAHIASLLQAPVVIVVNGSGSSISAAAVAQGMATYSSKINVVGVIANRVSSPKIAAELAKALEQTGLPLLGTIPTNQQVSAPSRHLGLIPAAERDSAQEMVDTAGRIVAENVDLDEIIRLASQAPDLDAQAWHPTTKPVDGNPKIAVAGGSAFTFNYPETFELLEAAGCEIAWFDPLTDAQLPEDTAGLYLGGGFPEVYAGRLADNRSLTAQIGKAVRAGLPTVAECAGLLYLCKEIDGLPMSGALDFTASMTPRLRMGYRDFEPTKDSVIYRVAEKVRFHQFHRTRIDGEQDWYFTETTHATYQHTHWAAYPQFAQRFAQAASQWAASPKCVSSFAVKFSSSSSTQGDGFADLKHHGDAELDESLVDLAVNVRAPKPPELIHRALAQDIDNLSAYPSASEARRAIAEHHGVSPEMVLPTAGGTQAFDLIAQALRPSNPLVIHPQFTEPEHALSQVCKQVYRKVLPEPFELDIEIDEKFDFVAVGNPTNPTGVLHRKEQLLELVRGHRVLLVDEAFMDAVPGEPESLIGPQMTGILVARSLTKTWSIAGVRAGYVVGDPRLIAALEDIQPSWSVSTPATTLMCATTTPDALEYVSTSNAELARNRQCLISQLSKAGFEVVGNPSTPFVLVNAAQIGDDPASTLREHGFAARSCVSFPGLGPGWLRIAVRCPEISASLASALKKLKGETSD